MTEVEPNVSTVAPMVVLPKIMSTKTFNRIYGTHETLGMEYKLHQKIIVNF